MVDQANPNNPEIPVPGANDAPAPVPDAPPIPEDRLQAAERKANEEYEARLRAVAEMDNVRKRAQADIAAAHRYALEKFALALLPIKDSLEATLATGTATHDALTSGVELTLRQLEGVFEKFSITEIHPVGEKFDPHRHQAMTMVESDQPVNTVVQVFQKGYLLFDRVIRPALVAVAKGKAG